MKTLINLLSAVCLVACGGGNAPTSDLVCVYGDSTTKRNPYTAIKDAGIDILAFGSPGARSDHLLEGRNAYFYNTWSEELKNSCTVVVLNFGLNDVGSGRYNAQSFAAQLSAMRDTARAAGKRVILETPNPTNEPTKDTLVGYVAAVNALGGEIVDNHALFGGAFKQEWMADDAHPNALGYSRKALNLLRAL